MADIDTKRLPLKVAGRLVVWGSIVAALVPLIFMLITSIKPAGDTQTIPPKWVFVPTLEHYEAVFGGQTSSSQAFLPLLTRSRGAIVNVLSVTAFAALPLIPAYSISKAAAFSLSQSLRALLAGTFTGAVERDVALGPVPHGVEG